MIRSEHIEELADKLINNHAKFESFAWFSPPEGKERWCIVYTSNRDADYITRSNHKVFEEAMAPFLAHGRDALDGGASHWACGYVDGFAIRVRTACGRVTRAFAAYAALELARQDYPVLDDELASECEEEDAAATWENMRVAERLDYLREHSGWEFHSFSDMLSCVRGNFPPYTNSGYQELTGN